jgi:serine/threonine protein phosphatase 1
MRTFIIGDIHGMRIDLQNLWTVLEPIITDKDTVVFCGDYIDRGPESFAVVEMLHAISQKHKTVFLTGNHEMMLADYLTGKNEQLYFINGGRATVKSYTAEFGSFYIPEQHKNILFSNIYYYEGDDFIAVHAGFNSDYDDPFMTPREEMVWIREKFYRKNHRWKKTVIFGHTPTQYIGNQLGTVFRDEDKNIIGIDTGAVYGGRLTCLVWPDNKIIQSIR